MGMERTARIAMEVSRHPRTRSTSMSSFPTRTDVNPGVNNKKERIAHKLMKDIHDRFTPENLREIALAWQIVESLGNEVSIGTARQMISNAIRIGRLNQPLDDRFQREDPSVAEETPRQSS